MAGVTPSPEIVREALTAVEQALYNHEQWHEELVTTLVCRAAPDDRDTAADAYRRCRFGQWYYGRGQTLLAAYPGFAEVEAEHRRMHELAGRLTTTSARGEVVALADYERFKNAVKLLRLEMMTVKQGLEDDIYNLDPLTGAANRLGMLSRLREQHELAKRGVQACAIAMMDLDLFKAVNDQYGHQTGDSVLAAAAHYVIAALRPYDRVFRYGGEEFLICLPDATLATGRDIVERLRAGLASLEHTTPRGPIHVTVSLGLARLDPDVPVEGSIEHADRALYAAKAAGRNQTVVWTSDLG